MSKENYRDMQLNAYNSYSTDYDSCKKLCVGNWEAHERYPYDKYLLEKYKGKFGSALDFGCGMGRMIKRMLLHFDRVDGADLLDRNLKFASEYLVDLSKTNLYQTNGLSCIIENKYDFIYSTICLQHICVHEIKYNILFNLYSLLNESGELCIQVGYGFDNGINWFSNHYEATSTNAGSDFCVKDKYEFNDIENDLKKIGFKSVLFTLKESPHPEITGYHSEWLFIHCYK